MRKWFYLDICSVIVVEAESAEVARKAIAEVIDNKQRGKNEQFTIDKSVMV